MMNLYQFKNGNHTLFILNVYSVLVNRYNQLKEVQLKPKKD